MQKKDVKVGEHYAYRTSSYGTAHEVEVVSLDGKVQQGYSFSRRTINGITVKRVDGPRKDEEFACTGRNLVQTWAEETAQRKARQEASDAAAQDRRETAARRANKARQIESLLAAHGETARPQAVFKAEQREALKAAGFEFETSDSDRFRENYTPARFNLGQFMEWGRIEETVVTTLLADVTAYKRAGVDR